MENSSFRVAVQRAIKDYNKFRRPEAKASLVKIGKNQLTIDLEGSFCRGCGVSDYFEDFIYELKRYARVKINISSFEQTEPEKFRVKYNVRLSEAK